MQGIGRYGENQDKNTANQKQVEHANTPFRVSTRSGEFTNRHMTLNKNATNRRAKSIPLIESGISEFAEG